MRCFEFDHRVCDDAGGNGGARNRRGRAAGGLVIDVLESTKHAPRNRCFGRHVVKAKMLKALNIGSLVMAST